MAKVNKTAVVVDNTSTRMPLTPLIERYSILLAHADLSLQAVAINTRSTGMAVVSTQAEADSVKAYYSALEQGATMAVLESTNMNSLADMQGMRVLSNVYPSSTSIKDFYSLQQNLLKSFYNDIGVRMSTDKRERLISDEVNSDEEMLLFNIDDALKCRQAACEKMNKLYGLNVSVRHAVDFSMSKNQEQEKQKEGDEDVK
jgi:DNA-binding transcriptional regulator YbjK